MHKLTIFLNHGKCDILLEVVELKDTIEALEDIMRRPPLIMDKIRVKGAVLFSRHIIGYNCEKN